MAALAGTPGWFNPGAAEPAPDDYAGRLHNPLLCLQSVTLPFSFNYRRDLEQRVHGNPSWNVGVDYGRLLAESVAYKEAVAAAFTPAEVLSAVAALLTRISGGRWDDAALQPAALNASASGMGQTLNQYPFAFSAGAASFAAYQPGSFSRPYDSRSRPPL